MLLINQRAIDLIFVHFRLLAAVMLTHRNVCAALQGALVVGQFAQEAVSSHILFS